jgi:D-proline reductase (dithiol) PrdB
MPRLEDLDPESRTFISNYQCRAAADTPWTPLQKPLSDCRIALVTSSGLIRKSDKPFDLANPSGDPTFRTIPSGTGAEELTLSIISANWDRSGFAMDVNVVFPMDRVRELAAEGIIGAPADTYYAFMGSIFDIDPVASTSAPQVGRLLRNAGVDIALLAPV